MKKLVTTLLVAGMVLSAMPVLAAATPAATKTKTAVTHKGTKTTKTTKVTKKPPVKKPAAITKPAKLVAAANGVKEFTMTAKDWSFSPSLITVKKGDHVKITIIGADAEHSFALSGYNLNVDLQPGQTQVVSFVADKAGTFNFRCAIPCGPGHRDMQGTLVVQA